MLLPPGHPQAPPCFLQGLRRTGSPRTTSQATTDLDIGSNHSNLHSSLGQAGHLHGPLLSLMPCLAAACLPPGPAAAATFYALPSHLQPRQWDSWMQRLGQGPLCAPNHCPVGGSASPFGRLESDALLSRKGWEVYRT